MPQGTAACVCVVVSYLRVGVFRQCDDSLLYIHNIVQYQIGQVDVGIHVLA